MKTKRSCCFYVQVNIIIISLYLEAYCLYTLPTNRVRGPPYCKVTDLVFSKSSVEKCWKLNRTQLESAPRSQGVRALEYGRRLNQPISAQLVPERYNNKLSYVH